MDLAPASGRRRRRGAQPHRPGRPASSAALLDEHGRLFLVSAEGLGIVHTADVELAARLVEAGTWRPETTRFEDLPARYGYVLSPAAAQPSAAGPTDPAGAAQPP